MAGSAYLPIGEKRWPRPHLWPSGGATRTRKACGQERACAAASSARPVATLDGHVIHVVALEVHDAESLDIKLFDHVLHLLPDAAVTQVEATGEVQQARSRIDATMLLSTLQVTIYQAIGQRVEVQIPIVVQVMFGWLLGRARGLRWVLGT